MSIRDKIPHLPEIHVESNLNLLLRRAKENRTVDIEEYVTTGGYSALRKALERLKPEDIVVLVEESTLREEVEQDSQRRESGDLHL